MSELVPLEHHRNFSAASNRARAIAIQHRKETALCRSKNGWDVLVPISLRDQLRVQDHDNEYDPGEDDYEYERDDERSLIVEEMMEDQESWARSDEDGWFYPDE